MPEPSIPADDSAEVTPPAPEAADIKNPVEGDDLDKASKSDDKPVADDDKKSEDKPADSPNDTPASKLDDDLDDWVQKRGLPKPTSDAEKLAYQKQRDEQREFTRERQAKKDAAELGKAVNDAKPKNDSNDDDDDTDPLEKRVQQNEEAFQQERTARLQSEFFTDNKVTPEQGKAIVEIAREKFNAPATDEGKKRAFELWSSTDALSDLLDLAKARLAQADSSVVADEAARQEREKIERESNAKSPGRSASQHTSSDNGDINSDEARKKRFEARYNK